MIKTITAFRHPRSVQNDKLPHGPNCTIRLTEEGFHSLASFGHKITKAGHFNVPQQLITTNYDRGRIGATHLQSLYPQASFTVDARLREYTWCDVEEGCTLTPEEKDNLGLLLRTDPCIDKRVSTLGETFEEFCERPKNMMQELLANTASDIVLKTHGHWIRCAVVQQTKPHLTTVELMSEMFKYDVVDNLDAVKFVFDTEKDEPPIVTHFKYNEGYLTGHAYTVLPQYNLVRESTL